MGRMIALSAGGALLAAGAMSVGALPAAADALVENSAEFRFQLDFQVNSAALQKLLPAGWEPAIATQGPAKDCNLRLIFIDRVDVTNPDNTPKTRDQLATIEIPVKQTGTNNVGRMIINALVSDPKQAPGPFGSYVLAPSVKISRSFSTVDSGLDIMKNASVPVKDRVKEFTYKATGGNIGDLFDGTEKVLSWDSFHWYNRGIYNP